LRRRLDPGLRLGTETRKTGGTTMAGRENKKAICAECGAVCDYCEDIPEDVQMCNQCACCLAGICDACHGPCKGLAWPKNYTHIFPRWPE
jgi:hypothetical protein